MRHLAGMALVAALLSGCGMPATVTSVDTSVAPAQASGLFSSFKEASYQPATFKQLNSFWDREGSEANDGKHFKLGGKLSAHPPDNFLEGWGSQIFDGQESAWIVSNKSFLTRGAGERYFEKLGAGTDEVVTVFFTVKESSSTKNRIEIDAVRRADGTLHKF